ALPRLFTKIKFGTFFGLAFFLCLWIAALNASVGLLETLISNYSEKFIRKDRKYSMWYIVSLILALTVIPAFSGSGLKNIRLFGQTLLENMDSFLINYLLPLSALCGVYVFFKAVTDADQRVSFLSEKSDSSYALINYWYMVLKWVAPILIILGVVLQLADLYMKYYIKN
ncbi:MAG: sodium-dependent transporter, partial [Pseudobdellovibrio sp.]